MSILDLKMWKVITYYRTEKQRNPDYGKLTPLRKPNQSDGWIKEGVHHFSTSNLMNAYNDLVGNGYLRKTNNVTFFRHVIKNSFLYKL